MKVSGRALDTGIYQLGLFEPFAFSPSAFQYGIHAGPCLVPSSVLDQDSLKQRRMFTDIKPMRVSDNSRESCLVLKGMHHDS